MSAAKRKRSQRIILVGGVFAVAALAVTLVFVALGSSVAYFYTPSDLTKLERTPKGLIRLGGLVQQGSVAFEKTKAVVHFVIADHAASTPVVYQGVLPDLFREGQGVVVQGRLVHGELQAVEVLAKHDERYMPREVAEALKKQGRWKEGETP